MKQNIFHILTQSQNIFIPAPEWVTRNSDGGKGLPKAKTFMETGFSSEVKMGQLKQNLLPRN